MNIDDDKLDPILYEHRVHIPAEFADMVTSMDAIVVKRKRNEAVASETGGPAYFDAVMSSFCSPAAV